GGPFHIFRIIVDKNIDSLPPRQKRRLVGVISQVRIGGSGRWYEVETTDPTTEVSQQPTGGLGSRAKRYRAQREVMKALAILLEPAQHFRTRRKSEEAIRESERVERGQISFFGNSQQAMGRILFQLRMRKRTTPHLRLPFPLKPSAHQIVENVVDIPGDGEHKGRLIHPIGDGRFPVLVSVDLVA